MRKLKFYLIGFVPGLIFVFFILNEKGVGCKGYMPSDRVIAETLSKKITYTKEVEQELNTLKINELVLKDSILSEGKIDFDKSKAQQRPCPEYTLFSPKENPRYEIGFQKCKDSILVKSFKKLK